jgi:radical SAM superfamily enzyme YgiQ (UPF0313 family)
MDLDSLPWPDYDGFEYHKYLENVWVRAIPLYDMFDFPKPYNVVASRSCPFNCTFCFHPLGRKYRQRSIDSIMEEIETNVKKYRANIIHIYDELFSKNRERVLEFCRRLKKFRQELSWECKWLCGLRVDMIDDELLSAMKDAGCHNIGFGIESYSADVLKSMRKHTTPQQIENAVFLTRKNKIGVGGNLIFGDPAETPQTVAESLDFWKRHNYLMLQTFHVNPYPGSGLYKYCIEKGIIKDRLDYIENHIYDRINMSAMTDREFEQMKIDLKITPVKYLYKTFPISIKEMDNGMHTVLVQCPDCRETIQYGNRCIESKLWWVQLVLNCRKCGGHFVVVNRFRWLWQRLVLFIYAMVPRRFEVGLFRLFKRYY